MEKSPLGQKTSFPGEYDPTLLFCIARQEDRTALGIKADVFLGYDLWNGWELSWLNERGKPIARKVRMIFDAQAPFLIESKSLKLYLGSFSMTKFPSTDEVVRTIRRDLEAAVKSQVQVYLIGDGSETTTFPQAFSLDDLDTDITQYRNEPGMLLPRRGRSSERSYVSHLLRSNCPVTGQPDWGSVFICFSSELDLDPASLLRYIVSYRMESCFHETTCERIFKDLHEALSPRFLIVKCAYTRRGGIDISPCRFSGIEPDREYGLKEWRQ